VFTALDAQYNPTAYANSGILVRSTNYGSTLVTPTGETTGTKYMRMRYQAGDTMSGNTVEWSPRDDHSLSGSVLTLADLGISAGTTIYGFSIMAGDVNASSASNLVNWNNTSIYPTTTAQWTRAADLLMPGQFAVAVPEPSTYGAIFMGAIGLIWGIIRYRRSRTP